MIDHDRLRVYALKGCSICRLCRDAQHLAELRTASAGTPEG
jgi:hypothetical protein